MTPETLAPVASLQALDRDGRGLRVEFLRLSDRYAHRVLAVGCEEMPILLLESVEGTPGDAWPASPALQSLNVDDLSADGAAVRSDFRPAMLVGMSGKSHWSLSIENGGDGSASRRHAAAQAPSSMLVFDAARRATGAGAGPGSHYALGPRTVARASPGGVELDFGTGLCEITMLSPGPSGGESPTCHIDPRNRRIGILLDRVDAPAGPGPGRSTLRWRYAISLRDK